MPLSGHVFRPTKFALTISAKLLSSEGLGKSNSPEQSLLHTKISIEVDEYSDRYLTLLTHQHMHLLEVCVHKFSGADPYTCIIL